MMLFFIAYHFTPLCVFLPSFQQGGGRARRAGNFLGGKSRSGLLVAIFFNCIKLISTLLL
ncbi:MAG: hypothetical protein D6730_01180 [Bacteroidetes bacterium]|nr:MAG: hypothetical protein D6730_01180 [Bacteroidota bacterium]